MPTSRLASPRAGRWHRVLGVQSRGELDRFVFESIWFVCPGFADGFKGREPLQGLETLGEVVGVEERCEVLAKLVVAVVVIAPDSRRQVGAAAVREPAGGACERRAADARF